MEIKVKSIQKTVCLSTLNYGDTCFMPSDPEDFYIVIEPDYELDYDAGIYCVNLRNGELYRFDACEDVVPVKLEATASF